MVENSILAHLDDYEDPQCLPKEKFGRQQYQEIVDLLKLREFRLRIGSYNVLFNLNDNHYDPMYRWPQRMHRIVKIIEQMKPDILGVQELYGSQIDELCDCLKESLACYTSPSSDGEHNAIFYRKDRLELIQAQSLLLPFDAYEEPLDEKLTMVHLKDKKTGKQLGVFNTHLPYHRINTRQLQARFIAQEVEQWAKNAPAILLGDLNTFPSRLDKTSFPFFDGDYIHRILSSGGLKDSIQVSSLGHIGPIATFTNDEDRDAEPFTGTGTPGVFLDHIYVSSRVRVIIHVVEPAKVNGYYGSDHMPVVIDCLID